MKKALIAVVSIVMLGALLAGCYNKTTCPQPVSYKGEAK